MREFPPNHHEDYMNNEVERNHIYKILTSKKFLDELIFQVGSAEKRVWIQTTNLEYTSYTEKLFHEMENAQNRGVDIQFTYDSYSDYTTAERPILLLGKKNNTKHKIDRNELLQRIDRKTGHNIIRTGSSNFRYLPLRGLLGMNHRKIFIIDNFLYIGGVNLGSNDLQRNDLMLKTNNRGIVSAGEKVYEDNSKNDKADKTYHCDKNNELVVDAGNAGVSRTMELVKSEVETEQESIIIVSQFPASGDLLRKLNHAQKRGVRVSIVTTPQTSVRKVKNLASMATGLSIPQIPIIEYPEPLHTKLILFGRRKAIIGSHNFDEFLVRLGTKEISLVSTQPELLSQVEAYLQNQLFFLA